MCDIGVEIVPVCPNSLSSWGVYGLRGYWREPSPTVRFCLANAGLCQAVREETKLYLLLFWCLLFVMASCLTVSPLRPVGTFK